MPNKNWPRPNLHASSRVVRSTLGLFVEVSASSFLYDARVSDYVWVGENNVLSHCSIGRFCSFANGIRVGAVDHPMERPAMHAFTYRSALFDLGEDDEPFLTAREANETVLGPDVWVGTNAVIMSGVKVGAGAVIGAGAIVTKDVPAFAVVAGNPAKEMRYRFEKPIRDKLLSIAWWDWPHEKLKDALQDFRALSIEAFCKKHG